MLRFGCADVSDDEFLSAFADGSLPPGSFHHGDHVRAAWLVLNGHSFEEALNAVRGGLQKLATRAGVPGHYHETITQGWMVLLATQPDCTFDEYVATLPEGVNPLHAYWSKDLLGSPEARAHWVEPDLGTLPPVPARQATLKQG